MPSSRFAAQPLTHRFTVLYTDGTTYEQNPDDRSVIKGEGSAFSDVDLSRVAKFFLESGYSDGDPSKHLYMVDLVDGHFEIDGVQFCLGHVSEIRPDAIRRLVYFRRVEHSNTYKAQSGESVAKVTRRHYCLGWDAPAVDGLTVRRTIEVGHEAFQVNE